MIIRNEDLRNEGLIIHTTLQTDMQDLVEASVKRSMSRLDKRAGFKESTLETAVVIVSHHDGEILALLGDRDPKHNAFNRALDARRPIGSLIKPAVYLAALDNSEIYNVLSLLDDSQVSIKQLDGKVWSPQNYSKQSYGKVPLLRAFTRSYNQSTVRLGMSLGLDKVINQLKNLGVEEHIRALPSLLLGSLELSPYQTAQMYQTIASDGLQVPLKTVRAVFDREGNALKRYDLKVKEFIKTETVFLMKYLLSQVVEQGTAKSLKSALPSLMPLAGKTGTTNDLRDTWFAGFGDRLLGIVWVGRDDNKTTKLTGATGAMQVWSDIMKELKPTPLLLLEPENIKWQQSPDLSNPPESCRQKTRYPFIDKNIPLSINCF